MTVLDENQRLVRVCTDRARVDALLKKERDRRSQEHRDTLERRQGEARAVLDRLRHGEPDSNETRRMFAMLVVRAVGERYGDAEKTVASAAKRHGINPDIWAGSNAHKDPVVRLAKYSVPTLAAFALDALISLEVVDALRRPNQSVRTLNVFLGILGQPEKRAKYGRPKEEDDDRSAEAGDAVKEAAADGDA